MEIRERFYSVDRVYCLICNKKFYALPDPDQTKPHEDRIHDQVCPECKATADSDLGGHIVQFSHKKENK